MCPFRLDIKRFQVIFFNYYFSVIPMAFVWREKFKSESLMNTSLFLISKC